MATRKVRRFNGTEESSVTSDELEIANKSEDPIASLNAKKGWTGSEESAPAPAKKQSFKEAFAEARKGGGKTFEWNGKKFTTEMAGANSPEKASASAPAPVKRTGTPDLPSTKSTYETPYDRMNRKNREESAKEPRGQDRILRNVKPGAVNPKTLLPESGYKKGGSVGRASGRADGIAQRGKTRGKMV